MAHHLKWSNVGGFEVLGQLQGLVRATYVSDSLIIMQKRTLICSTTCSLGLSFFSHNNLEHEFKYLSSQTATLKSWIAIQLKFKRQTNKAKQSKLKPNRKGTWQTFFCLFLFVLHSLYTCRLICNNCKKQTGRLTRLSIVQNARGVSGQARGWSLARDPTVGREKSPDVAIKWNTSLPRGDRLVCLI